MDGQNAQHPNITVGDVVKFYKPLVVEQLPASTLILKAFPEGKYTITKVGSGGKWFCIQNKDIRYRFVNAYDSITKYE